MSNQPQTIRDVYFEYVSNLYLDWYTYEQLFGEKETVDLINNGTGFFFARIQIVYRERLALEIAKLFDRSQVCGKDTAALLSGIAELNLPATDPKLLDILNDYDALKILCADMIAFRHRHGAHMDKKILMEVDTLNYITRQTFREAVEGVGKIVSKISMAANEGEIAFTFIQRDTGIRNLLRSLEKGQSGPKNVPTDFR